MDGERYVLAYGQGDVVVHGVVGAERLFAGLVVLQFYKRTVEVDQIAAQKKRGPVFCLIRAETPVRRQVCVFVGQAQY